MRDDLDAVLTRIGELADQAVHGANDGRLIAAAPIPGGDALVLLGPAGNREVAGNRLDSAAAGRLRKSRLWAHYADDHRGRDLEPPLSLLAAWEDIWRAYLRNPTRRLASEASAVDFFDSHLTLMAQVSDGPDITVFAGDIANLRTRLEAVLHDEQPPERGVECFECGVRLVRRIRDRRSCRHTTPARAWFRVLLSYPELGVRPTEVAAARLPCEKCTQRGVGGVDNPAPGLSWECPGCRKEYTPGEYATAVRRDLSGAHEDEDGRQIGWTSLPIAAAAAAEITGRPISTATIRTWITRGSNIGTVCQWEAGRRFGVQLVFWPDVDDRINEQRKSGRPARQAS